MSGATIPERVLYQARTRPTKPAYYAKQGGQWRATTWRQYADEIRTAARALIALGLPPRRQRSHPRLQPARVGDLRPRGDGVGGAPAGIYTTCSPAEVQYIVDHAEAPVVLVEDAHQWKKIERERANLPQLQHVVMMKGAPRDRRPARAAWEEFLAKGAAIAGRRALDERIARSSSRTSSRRSSTRRARPGRPRA